MKKIAYRVMIIALSLIVLLNLYFIVLKFVFKTDYPNLFGFSCAIIASGSMQPRLNVFDLAFYLEKESYEIGDIIIFEQENYYITHRIIDIKDEYFITKGDFNISPDNVYINHEDIKGAYIFKIPYVGKIISFFSSYFLLFLILILGIILKKIIFDKNKDKIKNISYIYVLYIFLIIYFFILSSYARYNTSSDLNGEINIASFYFNGIYDDTISTVFNNLNANESNFLNISIVNFNQTIESEVNQEYTILIKTTNNLPLTFYLTANEDDDNYINSGDFVYNANTDFYEISTGKLPLDKTTHNYTIEIEFTDSNYKYNDEIDAIQIILKSQQSFE